MVEHARDLAGELGLQPYYMYRQKYMAGNLENVGYARPGNACIYNIAMMDELRDVMALGMGGSGQELHGGRPDRAQGQSQGSCAVPCAPAADPCKISGRSFPLTTEKCRFIMTKMAMMRKSRRTTPHREPQP